MTNNDKGRTTFIEILHREDPKELGKWRRDDPLHLTKLREEPFFHKTFLHKTRGSLREEDTPFSSHIIKDIDPLVLTDKDSRLLYEETEEWFDSTIKTER